MIVAYISGHGFGHVTRCAEVLRAIRAERHDLPLAAVCSAPPELLASVVRTGLSIRHEECDVGLVQRGALVIDEQASLDRWRGFVAGWRARVERESQWLRESGARLVLGDVPPLAFEAAARAAVPSVALANFSWDWIYRHLARRHAGLNEAADWAATAYRQTTLLLRLPYAGDLSVFPHSEDIPLVARRPRIEREQARHRLGLDDKPTVLWSFGGHALPGFDARRLGRYRDFRFMLTNGEGPAPENVLRLSNAQIEGLGLEYIDLVGAADVVVTKPGYGIVTDALAARTRMVYTDRGDFPEYPILVAGMAKHLPCVYVTNAQVLAGEVGPAIERALNAPWPDPPRLDGADVAARRILEIAGQ
jgi:UDP:flavonoid glycosyltransferase YjiC (YdhE family)